ncbi:MAG: methyltransferase [Halioglobus sp.]|nr:methyltransferase [Halioglobus sp.]|tara:strand:- start:1377 stop:2033 length:657 start_codon:yes stop_codon:yes gene_type:complete
MSAETHCPLCAGREVADYARDTRRGYLHCGRCALVFVEPRYLPDRASERAEYDLHDNDVRDPAYRAFLSRLAEPLVARLPPAASGLDFGCGPGPALACMLRERGFEVALYDPFYAPDRTPLQGSYDFISATEVVEHLHRPGEELARLWSLLRPGGWLGVMTKLVRDRAAFANWHYKNDPTHVCFFSAQTWRWWAAQRAAQVQFIGADVILLQRPAARA